MRLLLTLLLLLTTTLLMAQDYSDQYRQLDRLTEQGKYRSALALADSIYATARQDDRPDELLKALGYRANLTRQLAEDGEQAALNLLRSALAEQQRQPVANALIDVMIGELYHSYAERNSYRLRNGAEVVDSEVDDNTPLSDYTMGQLLTTSRQYLYRGLQLARENRTALAEIPALIEGGESRTAELPTLYGLLVKRALDVLGSNLGSVTDELPADADSLLLPAPDYCNLDLGESYDTTKGTPRKLLLYQEWLSFHLDEGGPALLYADLERMRFVHRSGAADSSYLQALGEMHERYSGNPLRDRILVEMARLLDRDDDRLGSRPRVRALRLLDQVGSDDETARLEARQLRAAITAPSLGVETENYYPRRQSLLVSVAYRNVERLHYRIYAYDPAEYVAPVYRAQQRLDRVMEGSPVRSGDRALAPNDDYSPHRTELTLDSLPVGGYYLLIGNEAEFMAGSSTFSIVEFQVSDLATVKINGENGGFIQAVNRSTGAPIGDVAVQIREQQRTGGYRQVATRRASGGGTFTLPKKDRYNDYQLILTHEATGDRLITNHSEYLQDDYRDRPESYTTLLTDRNLYRPGQTVHIYGLAYRTDLDRMPSIDPGSERTIVLRDANYQEIAQRQVTADDYGRFSLEFTLPEGGLTGNFTIDTDGGSVSVQVEEYKRPRFKVALDEIEPVAAGETVTVTGKAATYAGPPVTQARVSYRVYIEERRWSFYYFRGDGGGERELLHSGSTETADDGSFSFDFTTRTDLNTGAYRRYRYVVETDVADATGETHEAITSFGIRGQRPAVALTLPRETVDHGDSLKILAVSDREDTTLTVTLRISPVTKPNAALAERSWPAPDRPTIDSAAFVRMFPHLPYGAVPEPARWPTAGAVVFTSTVALVQGKGSVVVPADFPVGHYRVDWSYPDGSDGEPVTFSVYNSVTATLPAGVLYQLDQVADTVVVGQPVELRLIAAVDLPLVFGKWQSRRGIRLDREGATRSHTFTYTPVEEDRGGIRFDLAFVHFNAVRQQTQQLVLPWSNRELTATYTTFRDKLRPGEPERWLIELRAADGSPVSAAALATMYDASLDQLYAGAGWQFSPYPQFYAAYPLIDGGSFGSNRGRGYTPPAPVSDTVPTLPELDLDPGLPGDRNLYLSGKVQGVAVDAMPQMRSNAAAEESMEDAEADLSEVVVTQEFETAQPPAPSSEQEEAAPVQLRTNLQETAFWLPDLTATADGALRIGFTSPEALTAWKFRLFAHDRVLNYVLSEREVVTQKELMVLPNVPRFVREGDSITLTARLANLTEQPMGVTVTLELFDPRTNAPVSLASYTGGAAGANQSPQTATLPGNGSETVRFPLAVPEGASLSGPLGYRIIARSANFSDGEENVMPVLSDRTLITVRQPFYLKRGDEKTLTLPGLASFNPSTPQSLNPISYTFQVTTNPAWLALRALPYLMEYPYDGTEQLANRYFANQLAYQTVSTKPVLEEVFRKWQSDSTALLSELEKNQSLKTALLTETPWVEAARSESEQRARIGDLFQLKRLAREQQEALAKLAARQESDGAYSWFPGGPSDRYMTQYVVETLARMRQLGVVGKEQSNTVAQITDRAIRYLDTQLAQDYERLFADTRDSVALRKEYRPSALQIHYLYARALVGAGAAKRAEVLDFYRERASASWTEYGLYEQALIALVGGEGAAVSEVIIASLRERALHSDEFGMYWKYDRGYRWNNLPLETHTRILEAFQRVDARQEELDGMRLWLLSHKRTNAWPTTKATAAAVYALLNTGEKYQAAENAQPIEASWAGTFADELGTRVRALQETAEAATGAFTLRVDGKEVTRDLATVKIKNPGDDLIWGGIYWQYTELASKVEASNEGPLSLERTLYRKVGDRLHPITENDPLHPGDRVTVRLTLRSDRDLDYVHLKDRRAATFEPVDALSTYRYENGLGYYFTPNDLATNFFIADLPKGTYTLEYDLFATYAGTFSNGLGRVECLYAPEFGGSTEGGRVVVR